MSIYLGLDQLVRGLKSIDFRLGVLQLTLQVVEAALHRRRLLVMLLRDRFLWGLMNMIRGCMNNCTHQEHASMACKHSWHVMGQRGTFSSLSKDLS